MATSGSFSGSGQLHLIVNWRQLRQNISGNSTTIEVKVSMYHSGDIRWAQSRNVTLTVDGVTSTHAISGRTLGNGSGDDGTLLVTRNVTIEHNDSGSKTAAISAKFQLQLGEEKFYYAGTSYPSISTSGNAVLNSIPRETTVSKAEFNSVVKPSTANSISLTVDKKFDDYTHLLEVYIGTERVRNFTSKAGTSIDFSSSQINTFIDKFDDSVTKDVTVRVTTRTTGGVTIGQPQEITFSVTLDEDSTKPTITSPTYSVRGSGYDKTINKLVRHISRANVSFSASGGRGATITSLTASVSGVNITRDNSGTSSWSGYTGVLTSSSNYTVRLTATNSRSQETTVPLTLPMLNYSPPTVSDFRAVRASSGTGVTIYRRSTFSNVTGLNNARTIKIYSKRSNTTSWGNPVTNVGFHSTYNGDLRTSNDTATRTLSYNYRIEVEDRFGKVATSHFTLGTVGTLMSFNKDRGVGIGKIHERGALDVQGDMYVNSEDLRTVPFQTAILNNDWRQSPLSGYGDVGYYKRAGIVYLSGMVRHDSPIYRQGLFTLPIGLRPGEFKRVHLDSAPSGMRIIILTSGLVRLETSALSDGVTWADLSTVSFPAGG